MYQLNKRINTLFFTVLCSCMTLCGVSHLSADEIEYPQEDTSVAHGHGGGHHGGHHGGGHHGGHHHGGHHAGNHHGGHHFHGGHNGWDHNHHGWDHHHGWHNNAWHNGWGLGVAGLGAGYWAGSSYWNGNPGYYYDPNYYYDTTTAPSVQYTTPTTYYYETQPDYQYYEYYNPSTGTTTAPASSSVGQMPAH